MIESTGNETKDLKASVKKSSLVQCFKELKESTKRWGDPDPSLVAKSEAISKSMFGASSRIPPPLEYYLGMVGSPELSNNPSIIEFLTYSKIVLQCPEWVTNAAIVSALSQFGIGKDQEERIANIVKGGVL